VSSLQHGHARARVRAQSTKHLAGVRRAQKQKMKGKEQDEIFFIIIFSCWMLIFSLEPTLMGAAK